jgi:MFS family permease
MHKPTLGLRANYQQFVLLIIVNAFVGGMVGLERSVFPQFAHEKFGISSATAILSFIIAFGITKAITNYFAGKLANHFGRRNLLLAGWYISLLVPILLIYATNWTWVVIANILLGMSQGLTWSSTVVMKIDLVGEKDRGLAMGLNEFAGYLAVGIVAFLTGWIANKYGISAYPFYLGIGLSLTGLLLTVVWVKDTRSFVKHESQHSAIPLLRDIFRETTFTNRTLSAVTQAGLVNNLNDGMIWGLLPMLLLQLHFDNQHIGIVTAIYPAVWGIGQIFTGKMSDIYPKKQMLFWGMFLQGIAIIALPYIYCFSVLMFLSAIIGIGTALVYPTFLSAVAQSTHPTQRAESLGIFRFWRDIGYAIGAIISGLVADAFGLETAISLTGIITFMSAIIVFVRMPLSSLSPKNIFL